SSRESSSHFFTNAPFSASSLFKNAMRSRLHLVPGGISPNISKLISISLYKRNAIRCTRNDPGADWESACGVGKVRGLVVVLERRVLADGVVGQAPGFEDPDQITLLGGGRRNALI